MANTAAWETLKPNFGANPVADTLRGLKSAIYNISSFSGFVLTLASKFTATICLILVQSI